MIQLSNRPSGRKAITTRDSHAFECLFVRVRSSDRNHHPPHPRYWHQSVLGDRSLSMSCSQSHYGWESKDLAAVESFLHGRTCFLGGVVRVEWNRAVGRDLQ